MEKLKTGIELIAEERQEQIEKHGRTVESDMLINTKNQLTDAARAILLNTPEMAGPPFKSNEVNILVPQKWNKDIFNKMFEKTYKERLIIAGALIAAEIDRLNALNK